VGRKLGNSIQRHLGRIRGLSFVKEADLLDLAPTPTPTPSPAPATSSALDTGTSVTTGKAAAVVVTPGAVLPALDDILTGSPVARLADAGGDANHAGGAGHGLAEAMMRMHLPMLDHFTALP